MSDKEFINNLSSTYADVRKLNAKVVDAKKIKLNGTNIEDLLSSAGSGVIIEDGREVKTKYDIWEHAAVENVDGSVTVKNLYIPDASGWFDDFGYIVEENDYDDSFSLPRNVIDNKVYLGTVEDYGSWRGTRPELTELWANMDTSEIVNGEKLFSNEENNG